MKKILSVFFVAVLFFTFACNNNSKDNSNNSDSSNVTNSDNSDNSNNTSNSFDFEELNFSASEIPNNLYTGTITDGKKWKDKAGINYFFISEKTTTKKIADGSDEKSYQIHGYHYTELDGNFTLIREIKDYQSNCDLILDCGITENTLEITDINANNYGEVSFMYYLYCAMDASPSTLKLMLLENGDKYAIRGTTILEMAPGESIGGKTNIDASFNNAPSGFKKFAVDKWNNHQKSRI